MGWRTTHRPAVLGMWLCDCHASAEICRRSPEVLLIIRGSSSRDVEGLVTGLRSQEPQRRLPRGEATVGNLRGPFAEIPPHGLMQPSEFNRFRPLSGGEEIVEPLPAWSPTRNRLVRLSAPPKHHLADPALASLLGSMLPGSWAASPWDRQACEPPPSSAPSSNHWSPWGSGLGRTVSDADVRHLHWLTGAVGDDVIDRVVVTTGSDAFRRSHGVLVVPAALLGP